MAYQTLYIKTEDISKFKTIEKRIMIIEEKHLIELASKISCDLPSILNERETLEIINGTTGNSETFKLDTDNNWMHFYKNRITKLTEKETVLVKYVLREVKNSKYDLVVIEKAIH